MSFKGLETFTADVGQFTKSFWSVLGDRGTLSFVSDTGVVTQTSGSSSTIWIRRDSGDGTTTSYVAMDYLSSVNNGAVSFVNANPGFFKSGNDFVIADFNVVDAASNSFGLAITTVLGGSHAFHGVTTLTLTAPFRVAVSLVGNVFTFYVFQAGVWVSKLTADLSAVHDFTAPGAMVGWNAGFAIATNNGTPTVTIDNLQWGPNADLTSSFGYFPPTALGATQPVVGVVDLFWTDSIPVLGSGFTGPPPRYVVYRNGVAIGNTGTNSYSDATAVAGNTYLYTVAAADVSNVPLSDQSTGLLVSVSVRTGFAFGKFALDAAYAPILLANIKGIKPRIYMPEENTTVRSRNS